MPLSVKPGVCHEWQPISASMQNVGYSDLILFMLLIKLAFFDK